MNTLVVNDSHGLQLEVVRGKVLRLEIIRDINKVGIQRDLYWRAVVETAQGQETVAVLVVVGPRTFAVKTWLCEPREGVPTLTETVTRRYEVGDVVTLAISKAGKSRVIDNTCFDQSKVA